MISSSSDTTTAISTVSLPRISSRCAIKTASSLISAISASRSSPVSLASRMSRIACAWRADSSNASMSPLLAAAVSCDDRMRLITASMLSTAICSPSRMCIRSFAWRRSNIVRRPTTSRRWAMKCCSSFFSDSVCGRPSTIASMLMPNESCICVIFQRLLSTTSGTASFLRSITIRMPSRSDSSRMSAMPSMRLSRTSSAIFSISLALLT